MTTPGPSDAARKAPLEEVLADYMQRLDRGEVVDRGLLLAEHPHLAEELQSYFADSDAVALLRRGQETLPTRTISAPAGAAPPVAPGTTVRYVGDYELLEEIAHGGMGVVYKARQLSLHRLRPRRTGRRSQASRSCRSWVGAAWASSTRPGRFRSTDSSPSR